MVATRIPDLIPPHVEILQADTLLQDFRQPLRVDVAEGDITHIQALEIEVGAGLGQGPRPEEEYFTLLLRQRFDKGLGIELKKMFKDQPGGAQLG